MTLFDTDVLVWALRGHPKALDAVDDAGDSRSIRKFVQLGGFQILPVSESVTQEAVSLMETLSLSNGLAPMDALIFATALVDEYVLCSANYKHYKDVPGLRARRFQP